MTIYRGVSHLSLFFFLLITLSGCGNDESPTTPYSPNTHTSDQLSHPTTTRASAGINSATNPSSLTWDAPAAYSDGSRITAGDIKGYKIYFSAAPGQYSASKYYFIAAPATTIPLTNLKLAPGKYCFTVTTIDSSNVESDFSNEVCKDVSSPSDFENSAALQDSSYR